MLFGLGDSSLFWHTQPGSGELAGPWLGGFQPPGESSPSTGWRWVDDDSFGYTNWSPGEPDNRSDNNVIGFGSSDSLRTPGWSDLDAGADSIRAAFIELSAETTTVGLTRFDTASRRATRCSHR